MRFRAPFQLFKKKLSSGTQVYYYTVYDELNKRRQYSTGCKNKSEAMKYCLDLYNKNRLLQSEKSTLFSKYIENWYVYDKCEYIQSVLARGKKYSRTSAKAKRSNLLNRILPYFKNYKLEDITPLHIEDWIRKMKKLGVSNLTINCYLNDLKLILKEAYRTGVIDKNPGEKVRNLAKNQRSKSVLNEDEVEKLFSEENREIWEEEMFYLFNLVASQTGMRMGEIQCLKEKHIHEDYIYVKHSWDRTLGEKSTKNGKCRIVPIKAELYMKLKNYIATREFAAGEYIFSHSKGLKAIGHSNIYRATYKAFELIGISKDERKVRNITIHSWRHYYNTKLLKSGIPKAIAQAIIGHATDDMTENYTKLTKDDLVNAVL